MILRAMEFAIAKHHGQLRKYTDEPYILHTVRVAQIVSSVKHSEAAVQAAILHDTLEDTDATFEEIGGMFGQHVAQLVLGMTDISIKHPELSRDKRKAMDCTHLAIQSAEVQTIKLADILDNTKSIADHDPDFAVIYMAEKRELLGVLTKGNKALHKIATYFVEEYFNDSDN